MKEKSFDDQIKQKADAHEATVPADAWANIEQQKTKRRFGFFWWSMAALLITGSIFSGIYFMRNTSQANDSATNIVKNENKKSQSFIDKKEKNIPRNEDTILVDAAKNGTKKETITTNNFTTTKIASSPKTKQNNAAPNVTSKQKNKQSREITTTNTSAGIASGIKKTNKRSLRGEQKITIQPGSTGIDTENNAVENNGIDAAVTKVDPPKEVNSIAATTAADSNAGRKKPNVTAIQTPAKKTLGQPDDSLKRNKLLLQRKNNFMADVAVAPFFVIQQKDKLNYITRTIITSSGKSEFKATDIHSTVMPSFNFSLALHKKMSGKLYVGAGLQYSIVKENIRLSGTETRTDIAVVQRLENIGGAPALMNDTIISVSSGTRIITATNSYRFITIPLTFHYQLVNKKAWTMYVSGGLHFNISSYNNSITGQLEPVYSSSSKAGNKENKLTTDLYAGFRLSRRFKKFDFFAEPGVLYNLNGYNLSNQINNAKLHKAGVAVGISWKF